MKSFKNKKNILSESKYFLSECSFHFRFIYTSNKNAITEQIT